MLLWMYMVYITICTLTYNKRLIKCNENNMQAWKLNEQKTKKEQLIYMKYVASSATRRKFISFVVLTLYSCTQFYPEMQTLLSFFKMSWKLSPKCP